MARRESNGLLRIVGAVVVLGVVWIGLRSFRRDAPRPPVLASASTTADAALAAIVDSGFADASTLILPGSFEDVAASGDGIYPLERQKEGKTKIIAWSRGNPSERVLAEVDPSRDPRNLVAGIGVGQRWSWRYVMALEKRGKPRYGSAQADIREELVRYGKKNGYPVHQRAGAVCACGGKTFKLAVDDTEGAAVRTCAACGVAHPMGDSDEYLADASLEECECSCGHEALEITAGVSLYESSEDVRWIYRGCRCPACGLVAVYADRKNELLGYRELLSKI